MKKLTRDDTDYQHQYYDAGEADTKIKELELELAAVNNDVAWQPIETAPKDGTEVIVYTPPLNGEDGRFDFEFYLEDEGGWTVHASHYEHFCMVAKGGSDCAWIGPSENPKYTYWKKLKPPIAGDAT